MGACSEDPHLCWASWLLGFTSLLLSVCSTGAEISGAHGSGGQESEVYVPLKGIRGGSVLFHVIKEPGTELEEISWAFGPGLKYRVMLRVCSGSEKAPTWISLQDKYQQRVHVPNMTSLRIENLTREDSGPYRARASLPGGLESSQIFHLTVYEPVPLPQILVRSLSITAGWCSVTLECSAVAVTEHLNVTWESKGLPRELEQRGTWGPAPNSWTLTVSLPLSQTSASFTCVVSNAEDQKTVTSAVGEVCARDSRGQALAGPLRAILGTIVAVVLIFGAGLCLWKTLWKKTTETEGGAELQEEERNQDGDIHYAELGQQESQEGAMPNLGSPRSLCAWVWAFLALLSL